MYNMKKTSCVFQFLWQSEISLLIFCHTCCHKKKSYYLPRRTPVFRRSLHAPPNQGHIFWVLSTNFGPWGKLIALVPPPLLILHHLDHCLTNGLQDITFHQATVHSKPQNNAVTCSILFEREGFSRLFSHLVFFGVIKLGNPLKSLLACLLALVKFLPTKFIMLLV